MDTHIPISSDRKLLSLYQKWSDVLLYAYTLKANILSEEADSVHIDRQVRRYPSANEGVETQLRWLAAFDLEDIDELVNELKDAFVKLQDNNVSAEQVEAIFIQWEHSAAVHQDTKLSQRLQELAPRYDMREDTRTR
jgi:hypothetical protein